MAGDILVVEFMKKNEFGITEELRIHLSKNRAVTRFYTVVDGSMLHVRDDKEQIHYLPLINIRQYFMEENTYDDVKDRGFNNIIF